MFKKTRAAEAEARKHKTKATTDDAPPTKKRKTKKRDRAAPTEPLLVEPISVARPASEHRERRLVVYEPASTEAPEAEENLAIDPTTAEDIGPHDNVEDIQNFKVMMHELKEAFHQKPEETKGSRERMKNLATKCVQGYNEAEKRKALGRPVIDRRMAAKKKKKPTVAEPEASR